MWNESFLIALAEQHNVSTVMESMLRNNGENVQNVGLFDLLEPHLFQDEMIPCTRSFAQVPSRTKEHRRFAVLFDVQKTIEQKGHNIRQILIGNVQREFFLTYYIQNKPQSRNSCLTYMLLSMTDQQKMTTQYWREAMVPPSETIEKFRKVPKVK